ncbi:MAG: cystathionine gamma-synthase, partial [Deltaproteobacteria bacterium]
MSLRSATVAAHAGVPEPRSVSAPHVAPLVQVSAYDFPTIAASEPAMQGDGYVYARHGLPNPDQLAR